MNKSNLFFLITILLLIVFGYIALRSLAPSLFPSYYLYLISALIIFIVFLQIDFEIFSLFSWHFYIGSILFLIIPIIIGQITRGAVRWINIGALTIQPSEIVRPFLLVFFANYLTKGNLTFIKIVKSLALLALPVFLIFIQPSLGVAILTTLGFLGIVLASSFEKKYLFLAMAIIVTVLPLFWYLLAPYQKQRITTFLEPSSDPLGTGYNSLQSQIAVGSGNWLGRGLGNGIQTQLSFLPERHTDFIFASVAEELGFTGAFLLVLLLFVLLYNLADFTQKAKDFAARAYLSGLFLILFVQTLVHLGMNLGLLPITGVPLPLVSAGGSSLLGTVMALAIALGAVKKKYL